MHANAHAPADYRDMPEVSVLVPVHNGARFLAEALESARAQTLEPLEIIVVDDGSTDGSAEIAAKLGATVIRQANTGTAAAVNAARAHATGELLALLDADDVWPHDKLARQVAALGDAGLVYSDLTVIDERGDVLQESWLDLVWEGPPPSGEHCFGALLAANPATASSMLVRADLFGPIPPHLRCADWWLTLAVAREGAIAYLPEPRTGYRRHANNLGLGTEGAKLGRAHVRRAATQRHFLATVQAGEATPLEIALAWNAFERNVTEALRHLGNPFETIVAVTDADRERAWEELAQPPDDPAEALAAAVRALAADPWEPAGHAALHHAWELVA
jgi:Glycosyl transferase family 2